MGTTTLDGTVLGVTYEVDHFVAVSKLMGILVKPCVCLNSMRKECIIIMDLVNRAASYYT